MNKNRERRMLMLLRQEQVDGLARRTAIGQAELGATRFKHIGAVELGFIGPARKNLGVLGHTGTIVVFNVVVDRGQRRLPKTCTASSLASLLRSLLANLRHVSGAGKLQRERAALRSKGTNSAVSAPIATG